MCKNMTDVLLEDAIEITWTFESLLAAGKIKSWDELSYIGGSVVVKQEIRKIAEQFEEKFPYETTWEDEGGELDYVEEIEKFATEKLIETFGTEGKPWKV